MPVTSSCTPVSTGVTSSRDAAKATCAIAVAKSSAGTRPESPVTSGIAGILLHRHGREREARGSAAEDDAAVVVDLDLDRRVGEPARDLGQEAAVDQDRARLVDGGLDRRASGCLVVEGGERESGVGCLDQHTGEDRLRIALRQELDDERHGFAEHIAIDVELHGRSLDIGLGLLMLVPGSADASGRGVTGIRF